MKRKGEFKGRGGFLIEVLFLHSPGGNEENNEKPSQISQCSGRDSKQALRNTNLERCRYDNRLCVVFLFPKNVVW
jgi:hypothetical protein